MGDDLLFYEVRRLARLWLNVAGSWSRPWGRPKMGQATPTPATPPRKRSRAPPPCPGFTHQPRCTAGAPAQAPVPQPPSGPPPRLGPTRGSPRHVDPSTQGWPHRDGDSDGGAGFRTLHANGHPSGRPWRPWHGTAWGGSGLATQGTLCQGPHVAPERLVWAVGAWAAGLRRRAVARGCEVAPNTVRPWRVDAADQLHVFSQSCRHDVRVTPVHRDARAARLRAVKEGAVPEAEARKRLSHAAPGVWVALAPVSQLLLPLTVGDRTRAVAPGVVPPGVQVLAPGGVPRCLTAGVQASAPALLTHVGPWVQPPRRQATGPVPTPRGRPWPPAALRPGDQRHAPAAPGPGAPSRRVRRPVCRRAGPRRAELAPQHRLHRAAPSHHPPAWGRGWAAGDDPVPRRGGRTAAAGPRSPRRSLVPASRPCPPALAAALTDSRDRRGQDVAATDPSQGRGTDRPRVDVARGAPVSGAAVAPAIDAVRGGYA
jgi:hypothetical protein